MKVYNEDKLIVYLTSVVFDTQALHHKNLEFAGRQVNRLAFVDETQSWKNGLQAAAYEIQGEDKIYLIIRGADVGWGKKIFKKAGADARFIPKSNEESSFKSSFQDWFYTSLLGSCGLAKIYQYDCLEDFYSKLKKDYPDRPFLAAGVSLGGFLAQKLYLQNADLEEARGFSGLSPWWTLTAASQDFMKEIHFNQADPKLITYYSKHDPFRAAPFFSRFLGQQKNVLLQPFQSRSNFLATLIERIYWAHIPHYYAYSKNGTIKLQKDPSKRESFYNWLVQPFAHSLVFNIGMWILGFLPTLLLLAALFILLGQPSDSTLSLIGEMLSQGHFWYLAPLALFLSGFYMLPGILSKSNFKYLIAPLNILLAWTGWAWICLLGIAVLTNRSRDLEKRSLHESVK